MFQMILKELRPALMALLVMTIITGAAYPAFVTVVAQALFPHQANGSLIKSGETIVGSELIGQQFSDPKYFWGRLSATPVTGGSISLPYNPGNSSGSNLGPTNPDLATAVQGRIDALKAADKALGIVNDAPVPIDLATASGSGLDPHISPAAAKYQIARVAAARKLPPKQVEELVARFTDRRQLGVLGEAYVNVLKLNLALDQEASKHVSSAQK